METNLKRLSPSGNNWRVSCKWGQRIKVESRYGIGIYSIKRVYLQRTIDKGGRYGTLHDNSQREDKGG